MSNDSQMQNAIMHQILNTAAKRQAQPLPGAADPNLKLTDVKNIDDARKLARQIVQTQGGDLAALGADNPQLKEVLANLGAGNPAPAAPAPAPAAGGPVDTALPNHFHPPGALGPAAGTQHGLDPATGEQPLPFEDSLPETPSLQQALQDGHNACQHNDVSALLHAVQTAVTGEAGDAGVPQPPSLAGVPPAPAAGAALPPGAAGTEVQSQLQQQQQQLSLLSQLQHQLMTQQVKQADQLRHPPIEPSSSPAPPPLYPGAYPPAPAYNPAATDVFRPAAAAAADAAAAYHAQEAERALRDMHAKQHNLAVAGAAFSPLASQPPPAAPAHPQPLWANEQPAFSSPLPPAPADAVAAAAAAQAGLPQATRDQLQQFQSIASTLQSEVPEELAAREQAHRIMVDFIAQKNLTNLLTEKLAEKTSEADQLRARLATGEGKESFHKMSETLGTYEKELSRERTRTLALEHELHKLRAGFEEAGVPLPKAKTEYEHEIANLKRKIEMQEQMIAEISRKAEQERGQIAMEAEGRLAAAASQSNEQLLREIDMLKAKLREKKNVNQELQDMLKLHLRYNSEIRTKSMLHQPQWVHPLLKEPQPSMQEFRDPLDRVEL